MDQAFDALLEFDERAVVGDADDASADMRADRIAMRGIQPRVRRELLESQRNPLLVFVELQHLHLDLIADIDQVARMGEASPGHIGDVQQAVDSAQVHERAVLGEVLHHAGENRAFFQVLQGLRFLFVLFLFQQLLARDHDVAALLVELDDGDFDDRRP